MHFGAVSQLIKKTVFCFYCKTVVQMLAQYSSSLGIYFILLTDLILCN